MIETLTGKSPNPQVLFGNFGLIDVVGELPVYTILFVTNLEDTEVLDKT